MRDSRMQSSPERPLATRSPPPEGLSRVVVATDFSPRSERALARAARLPLRPGARVHLLHVLGPSARGDPLDSQEREVVERELRAAAHAMARRARRGGPAVEVSPVLRQGAPAEEVARCMEEVGAELLVMGRPRHPSFLWRQGTAFRPEERLLRRVSASLLLVAPREATAYRRPLVAVDFSPPARRALELTLLVCPRASQVGVVHVCDTSYELVLHQVWSRPEQVLRYREEARAAARAELERLLACVGQEASRLEPLVLGGSREEGVLAMARKRQPDLIALGSRRSMGLAEVLLGTLAGRVLRETACDVLIAREPLPA
ncbi:universal stress protein [Hyalangium gracile]|uniref:universal stress protein n=1 Tax=Hyalangium gracile TaxID=394092 RepID=UPI001CC92F2D|nr:universal stress protein [Hyalangium gracile]